MDKEIRKVDDIRDDISKIDYQIAELFEKRMGFAAELALSKKAFGESIYNKNKEDEKEKLEKERAKKEFLNEYNSNKNKDYSSKVGENSKKKGKRFK